MCPPGPVARAPWSSAQRCTHPACLFVYALAWSTSGSKLQLRLEGGVSPRLSLPGGQSSGRRAHACRLCPQPAGHGLGEHPRPVWQVLDAGGVGRRELQRDQGVVDLVPDLVPLLPLLKVPMLGLWGVGRGGDVRGPSAS